MPGANTSSTRSSNDDTVAVVEPLVHVHEVHPDNTTSTNGQKMLSNSSSHTNGQTSFYNETTNYVNIKHNSNRSSLDMRKLPVSILLQPDSDDVSLGASTINDSYEDMMGGGQGGRGGGHRESGVQRASRTVLQNTCLNSNFSLRTQMMLSFGTVSCLTIGLVVAVSLVATVLTGDRVGDITQETFSALAQQMAGTTAHYLSDDLTLRIFPVDLIQILFEATRDRFAGYPTYEDDSQVPFFDIQSKQNRYPIQGTPLPLDWQEVLAGGPKVGNVNATNAHEHVQDRLSWYDDQSPTLDTSSAAFYMQGMCDPSVPATQATTNSRYFPNCTDANNDISTGGVVAPSPTTAQIHRKASDLTPILKSLYEYHQDVKNIGIYFANSGAGATVVFPHQELNYSNSYNSSGCNWMLDDHPLDPTRTVASLEDFERCELNGLHVNGETISSRLYNPMDRQWCSEQALNPHKVHHVGPIESAWRPGHWTMTLGRSVYDRITNEFVACVGVGIVLDSVETILEQSKITPNSDVSVVRFNEMGSVVASTAWNSTFAKSTVLIHELNVGLDQESYKELYNLVNYRSKWDPDNVTEMYEEHLVHSNHDYLVAAYPMPPIPKTYKDNYRPEFLVLVSVAGDEFFRRARDLKESVDETAESLGKVILVMGCAGIFLMVAIIFMVANALTSPLTYMNTVASDIITHFGDTAEDGKAIEVDRKELDSRCVPKTELDDIVKEFLKMVRNFSGSNMAKNAQQIETEINNRFSLVDEFRDLYESRSDPKFKYKFPPTRKLTPEESVEYTRERKGADKDRVNFGRNVNQDSHSLGGSTVQSVSMRRSDRRNATSDSHMASPLFFWIVVLIVTPLLLTQITISCVLMVNISKSFPSYVNDAKEQFVKEEILALETYVGLRAHLTGATTERAIRDNHVLARYISWILFGGLNRTDGSFIEMTSGVEECKTFANLNECPYVQEKMCDCNWNDKRGTCYTYNLTEQDSRYFQLPFYAGLSDDIQPDGDRLTTSYPNVAYSPETTSWWDNVSEVPGSDWEFNSTRYDSTYDRLGSAAALPVLQLLYNYDVYKETTILGVFVAFEDDGLFIGYEGCSAPGNPAYAQWFSSVENGAYDLRPELCPLGKYGYDPRCRAWYHKGKNAKEVNESYVYATPPYLFAATQNMYAQSATSPIVDPKTGKYVGQTLIDFVSQPILDSLNEANFALSSKGFPILITIEEDNFGADTVIGPGLEAEAKPIADLVLPYGPACEGAACDEGFYAVLSAMKAGKSGNANFTRAQADGSTEAIHISYAPVVVESFRPVDSSDFSRGVVKSKYLLYSIAFAELEDEMLVQFSVTEEEIDTQFYITLAILCITFVLSILFVVYFSNVITVSMTEPMFHLLELVRLINKMKDGEDRPEPVTDHRYGSREVWNVTRTMERLYKVIRSANTAFFAGDVETAYEVLTDALKLFKRLGNKKAIGVACNNLGNTMLAAYRTLKSTKEKKICGFKKREIIAKGTACFHEAITQGEAAYDEFYEREGWSPNCLEFMQHLSNRYFNRAMFLLTVKNDHTKPDEIQELGMRDLQISRDMDVEINDEGTQIGWNVRGVDKKFNVMLSRFKGHLYLLEMGYPDDFDLEEWMGEAYQIVKKELRNPENSELFAELGPAGRMQQIELELMKYYGIIGDLPTAAKIAIRMLIEDEYTLPSAQLFATSVLHRYITQTDTETTSDLTEALAIFLLRVELSVEEVDTYRASASQASVSLAEHKDKSESMCVSVGPDESIGKSSEFAEIPPITPKRRISLMQSSRGDITMEMF